ncbi:MAG TPA: flavodoxin family protein [Anaerolineaceae bacterium]
MRILGINGSPHAEGNTAYALRYALNLFTQAGEETEYISLAGKQIHACEGSFACRSGTCVYDDDMTAILEAMRRCDGLLLASPVYMGMVTGQLKTLMDRSVLLRVSGWQMSGKIGAGIACGGFRNGGQELTLQCMHTYFLQQDMAAIADGPRFSHSGATIVGRAAEDTLGLETIRNLVEKFIHILRK